MKNITGFNKKNGDSAEGNIERPNELNTFFSWFNSYPVPTLPLPPLSLHSILHLTLYSTPLPGTFPSLLHLAPPPSITADQVRNVLRRLQPTKNVVPDRVCHRLLRACAAELGEPLQQVYNLSLHLWKMSCIDPGPKNSCSIKPKDFRPVALTSHVMKVLDWLILHQIRHQVQHAQDPAQFAYREKMGVEDAVLYLQHRALSYLDKGRCTLRILFFDYSSAFHTIQPPRLRLASSDPHLVTWVTDYLTYRPQFVRLGVSVSITVTSSTGACRGLYCVLSSLPCTQQTTSTTHSSATCRSSQMTLIL